MQGRWESRAPETVLRFFSESVRKHPPLPTLSYSAVFPYASAKPRGHLSRWPPVSIFIRGTFKAVQPTFIYSCPGFKHSLPVLVPFISISIDFPLTSIKYDTDGKYYKGKPVSRFRDWRETSKLNCLISLRCFQNS